MNYKELMGNLFDFNPSTFYTWKKQNRPIISLLEKYFSQKELEEFLETSKIGKFENLNNNNFLEQRCFDFYINLSRSFRKSTVNLIVEFIIEKNTYQESITIEKLAQFIFDSKDTYFKIKGIDDAELAKFEGMDDWDDKTHIGNPYPSSSKMKLSVLKKFQDLDNIIFNYFCSHINVMIELYSKRPKTKHLEF